MDDQIRKEERKKSSSAESSFRFTSRSPVVLSSFLTTFASLLPTWARLSAFKLFSVKTRNVYSDGVKMNGCVDKTVDYVSEALADIKSIKLNNYILIKIII